MFRVGSAILPLVALVLIAGRSSQAQSAAPVFMDKCAACHSDDGSGSGSMGKALGTPDLRSAEVQKKTDAQLNDSITKGVGKKMPAYKDTLTEEQIKGLVGYIRNLPGRNSICDK